MCWFSKLRMLFRCLNDKLTPENTKMLLCFKAIHTGIKR